MQLIKDKRNSIFLVGFLTTIVVIPNLLDPINLPKLFLITLGTGVILGLFWSEIQTEVIYGRKAPIIVVGFLLCSFVVTGLLSPQPIFQSIIGTWGRNNGLLTYLCLSILLFVMAIQKTSHSALMSIKSLSLLGIGSSIYGFFQSLGSDIVKWNNPGNSVILTLGNSNFASALLALTAIACVVNLAIVKSVFQRMSLVFFFLFEVYLILKSEAVQGFVTVFFGTSLFVGLLLLFSEKRNFRKISMLWWSTMLVIGTLSFLSLLRLGPLTDIMSPYLFSIRDRYYHWVAAINMMRDYPFFGVGIDSFGDFYLRYRVQEAIDARGTASFGTNNAHNTFLQFGATGGLVLFVAYFTLILFIGYRSIVALKISQNKTLVSGVFSIWITFQVQTLVSIDQIGIVIWGWILGGCLVSASYGFGEEKPELPKSNARYEFHKPRFQKHKTTSVFVASVALLPTLALIPTILNEFTLRESLVSLVNSSTATDFKLRAPKVVISAGKSRQPELRLQAANYLVQAGLNDEALILTKLNNLEFPNSFESWDATAQIYEGLGDKKSAIEPRSRTVLLDPLNTEVRQLLEKDQTEN